MARNSTEEDAVVVAVRFYTALFSALEKIRYALVVCDSKVVVVK